MLSKPGPVALRAVADFEANTAVREEGFNAGKAVETYLASVGLTSGAPWCASVVYFRIITASHALGIYPVPHPPKSGYVPDWQDWAKDNGLWIPVADVKSGKTAIARGDLCLFYFAAKGRVAHMGMVTGTREGGRFNSVEGNTSDGSGVNRDGDGIYPRVRALSALGAKGGFVRLLF